MKKLLGIIASARKIGNTEIVTKAVAEKLGIGWELSLVRLPELEGYVLRVITLSDKKTIIMHFPIGGLSHEIELLSRN